MHDVEGHNNNRYCFLYDFRYGFFVSIGVCTVVDTY